MSYQCNNKKINNNIQEYRKQEKDIDEKIIKLNNNSVYSIFDSGSSESFIGKNILQRLWKNTNLFIDKTHKEFELLNGNRVIIKELAKLELEYKERKMIAVT